jgi:hypothetical protein
MAKLNPVLVERQGLNEQEVSHLERLHYVRKVLFQDMEQMDPKNDTERRELRYCVQELEALEFEMQKAWKFEEDKTKHTWWFRAPHCICPKLDNMERFGAEDKVITADCPLHGYR